MCGIAGFCNFKINYRESSGKWYSILTNFNHLQEHRGPDQQAIFLGNHCGLAHVRLSILDITCGRQPMSRRIGDHRATLIYNGEIYNMPSLRQKLIACGIDFKTTCDTEVLLMGYLKYGIDFVKELNGIFAFCIWDETLQLMYLVRDRMGVKPLFYTIKDDTLIFSSEIKGILSYPSIEPIIDREGLCEIFGLGPAKTYGKGVFRDIKEVLPGHLICFTQSGIKNECFWKLEGKPHEDNWEKTVEKTRFLVVDSIKQQMLSDVPICTFLSGGLDSGLVTAVCNDELKKKGKQLNTYSFDFKDNHKNFKANSFQPSEDRPYVDKMVAYLNTRHQYLECDNEALANYLYAAVDARDLPCMADVESSMLFFCEKVARFNKVALTGECADEIFGGYPWFHKKECFDADCFPWSMDFKLRTMLLKEEISKKLPLEEYAEEAYKKTISETPVLYGENKEEKRRREIAYLNLKWFMQTLLDRMDRTAMHVGLEARVPFADYRIVEYVFNIPWEMKCKNGVVKGLLREAAKGYLPDEILYRKKSPYPKTYNPEYEKLIRHRLLTILQKPNEPLNQLIDLDKVKAFMEKPTDYGRPFYGQLMAGPQLLAYLLQVNYWLKHYKISIKL